MHVSRLLILPYGTTTNSITDPMFQSLDLLFFPVLSFLDRLRVSATVRFAFILWSVAVPE